jgi:hypothetical protein
MAEAYAIYQGVLLVHAQQMNHITIVGDSKNIIQHFFVGTTPKNTKLQRIINKTKSLMSPIQAKFLHILHGNNREADKMENHTIDMVPGHMKVQGQVLFVAPP